jgi:hypothetical protein
VIKPLNFDPNEPRAQFAQKRNKIKSASTSYFGQAYLPIGLASPNPIILILSGFRGSPDLWILLGISWLQGELYTDFWLAISFLHVAFHGILLILFALILS